MLSGKINNMDMDNDDTDIQLLSLKKNNSTPNPGYEIQIGQLHKLNPRLADMLPIIREQGIFNYKYYKF